MKKRLFLVFYAFLLTMCRSYSQIEVANPIDGLSCQNYKAYFEEGFGITSKGVECSYVCSNGEIVGPRDFDVDPSLSTTKADLDLLFCGIVPPTFTPAVTLVTNSPTPAETPTVQASATATVTALPTSVPPLLTDQVTMCDTGANLISFRIAEPIPDLTGRTVEAEIAGQESICTVNPVNTSLLTCTMPPGVIFPAPIIVSLDGTVVNEFTFNGIGCNKITTPVATTTP